MLFQQPVSNLQKNHKMYPTTNSAMMKSLAQCCSCEMNSKYTQQDLLQQATKLTQKYLQSKKYKPHRQLQLFIFSAKLLRLQSRKGPRQTDRQRGQETGSLTDGQTNRQRGRGREIMPKTLHCLMPVCALRKSMFDCMVS